MRSFCARPIPRVSCVVSSFNRCASPPLRVGLGCPSFRYPKPGIDQERASGRAIFWLVAKNVAACFDRHLHHVTDRFFVVEDFERLRIVTATAAIFARHITARQKTHLELDHALALAGFATAAFRVEGEPAGRITAHARDRQLRVEIADLIEHFDVSCRGRARRLPDRRLIDFVDRLKRFGPCNGREQLALFAALFLQTFPHCRKQDRTHQRRFSLSRKSR